ncbi:hypothetical protein WJX84_002159 [Apatococcus fuscideae]|uniref:Uncharacterized protein n=1 Tax=Apatococcus fuscideae TaxID=2026836 RepID=A0AAW1SIZ4_9CHLO
MPTTPRARLTPRTEATTARPPDRPHANRDLAPSNATQAPAHGGHTHPRDRAPKPAPPRNTDYERPTQAPPRRHKTRIQANHPNQGDPTTTPGVQRTAPPLHPAHSYRRQPGDSYTRMPRRPYPDNPQSHHHADPTKATNPRPPRTARATPRNSPCAAGS